MKVLGSIFLIFIFSSMVLGDQLYLKDGTIIKGEIEQITIKVIKINTQIGQQLINRENVDQMIIDGESQFLTSRINIKKERPLYLLPLAFAAAFISIDQFYEAADISDQIKAAEELGVSVPKLESRRTRKRTIGILTGIASAATFIISFMPVHVIVSPEEIQLSYRF